MGSRPFSLSLYVYTTHRERVIGAEAKVARSIARKEEPLTFCFTSITELYMVQKEREREYIKAGRESEVDG